MLRGSELCKRGQLLLTMQLYYCYHHYKFLWLQVAESTPTLRKSTPQLPRSSESRKRKSDSDIEVLLARVEETRKNELKTLMDSFNRQSEQFMTHMSGMFGSLMQSFAAATPAYQQHNAHAYGFGPWPSMPVSSVTTPSTLASHTGLSASTISNSANYDMSSTEPKQWCDLSNFTTPDID